MSFRIDPKQFKLDAPDKRKSAPPAERTEQVTTLRFSYDDDAERVTAERVQSICGDAGRATVLRDVVAAWASDSAIGEAMRSLVKASAAQTQLTGEIAMMRNAGWSMYKMGRVEEAGVELAEIRTSNIDLARRSIESFAASYTHEVMDHGPQPEVPDEAEAEEDAS